MKIRITHLSPKTVATVQTLRTSLRLSVKEAKAIVEGPEPHEVSVPSEDKARDMIAVLAALGNKCEVIPD